MADANPNLTESEHLRKELLGLFQYIQRVRQEIAAINRGYDDDSEQFESMSEQLDAIVAATEEATNTIMGRMEDNDKAVDELRKVVTDPDQVALLDRINGNGNDVYQACSFQDITGQRVTKIVKSVTYVEQRVNALVDVWGKDELDKVTVKTEEKTEDEKLLRGPALASEESLNQADIDALFD